MISTWLFILVWSVVIFVLGSRVGNRISNYLFLQGFENGKKIARLTKAGVVFEPTDETTEDRIAEFLKDVSEGELG